MKSRFYRDINEIGSHLTVWVKPTTEFGIKARSEDGGDVFWLLENVNASDRYLAAECIHFKSLLRIRMDRAYNHEELIIHFMTYMALQQALDRLENR